MLEGIMSDPVVTGLRRDAGDSKLERACAEFESIFIAYILKSTRTTTSEGGLLGNSNEAKIVKSMFDENLALEIARGGGMGLGKMLFEQLRVRNLGPGAEPEPPPSVPEPPPPVPRSWG